MVRDLTEDIRSDLLKIGIYQIAGGLIGVAILLFGLWQNTDSLSNSGILISIALLIFFAYSIFCGVICLDGKSNALQHSLINQLAQLITFSISGYSFVFSAGVYIIVGIDLTNEIKFNFDFGFSRLLLGVNTGSEQIEIALNLVAVGMIYWIGKVKNKVQLLEENKEIDSLGRP